MLLLVVIYMEKITMLDCLFISFSSLPLERLNFDYGDNIGVRHYFGMAGFTAEINKSLHLEPSILVKTIDAGPMQLDINTV